MSDLPGSATFQ